MIPSLPQPAIDILIKELNAKQTLTFVSTSKKEHLMREYLLRDVLLFSLNRCTDESERNNFIAKYKPFYVYFRVKADFCGDVPKIANFLRIENENVKLHENIRSLIIDCVYDLPLTLPESLRELEFTFRFDKPFPDSFKLPSKLAVLRFDYAYPHSIKHIDLPNSLRVCELPIAKQSLSAESLQLAMTKLDSNDPVEQLGAVMQVSRTLAGEDDALVNAALPALPQLVALLRSDAPNVKFEAVCALANIVSSNLLAVVDAGALPLFVDLTADPNEDVRCQATWALGKIAGDSPHFRDLVLSFNAMERLLPSFVDLSCLSMIRNAVWTLSKFCRGRPAPQLVAPALPVLRNLIASQDREVNAHACRALSYLSEGTNDRIQAVLDAGVLPRLVQLLSHPRSHVQTLALRCIGNIVTGNETQVQAAIDSKALPALERLLESPQSAIRKDACLALSKIVAGTFKQIGAVIETKNIIPQLVEMLSCNQPLEIRKEACRAISNATRGGTSDQIDQLVQCGIIPPLVEMLECSESKLVQVALEAIENILNKSADEAKLEEYLKEIESNHGKETLKTLSNRTNQEVCDKSVVLLQKFFDHENRESEN